MKKTKTSSPRFPLGSRVICIRPNSYKSREIAIKDGDRGTVIKADLTHRSYVRDGEAKSYYIYSVRLQEDGRILYATDTQLITGETGIERAARRIKNV